MTWNAVSGAGSYVVLRGQLIGGAKSQVASPAVNSFTDGGLGQGVTEFYAVQAVGPGGTSEASSEVSATTAIEPAPEGLVATGGAGQISLSWSGVAGAVGYTVLRSSASGAAKTPIATPTGPAFIDLGLSPGFSGFYSVRTTGPAGTSVESAEVNATTLVQQPPVNLVATGGTGQIALRWDAAPPATAYSVFFRETGTASASRLGTTPGTSFTDSGLHSHATRLYAVRASGPAGDSVSSVEVSATTAGPATPLDVVATAANDLVTLTWSAVAGASSYRFRRINGASELLGTSQTTSLTDLEVRNGVAYRYTVTAVDDTGESTPSAEVTARPFRELCVSRPGLSRIEVFNAELDGSQAPSRSFGSQTGLSPSAIAVDLVHREIFSANAALDTVTSHAADADGNVAPIRALTGIGNPVRLAYDPTDDRILVSGTDGIQTFERTASGQATPVRVLRPSIGGAQDIVLSGPAHGDRLFVLSLSTPTAILVYSRTDSGFRAPAATITSQAVQGFFSLGYDPVSDEILAGASFGESIGIVAFPASSNGDTPPSRVLKGDQTGLLAPVGFAVDAANDLLHVSDFLGRVLTFPRGFGTAANLAPTATIIGPNTQMIEPTNGLALDPTRSVLTVASGLSILSFDAAASGDVAPLSALSSAVSGVEDPGGVALDASGGQILVANGGAQWAVTTYPRAAQGDATFSSSLSIELGGSSGPNLSLDPAHAEIVVGTGVPRIPVYSRTASGPAAPLRTIAGPRTLLQRAESVALDVEHDAIVVNDGGVIRRYARSFTDGDEAPLTTIQGANTDRSSGRGIAVDGGNGELVIARGGAVTVFHVTDDGNATPVRDLVMDSRFDALDVLIDPVADELFVLGPSTIRVFSRTASGADAPLREIAGLNVENTISARLAICN